VVNSGKLNLLATLFSIEATWKRARALIFLRSETHETPFLSYQACCSGSISSAPLFYQYWFSAAAVWNSVSLSGCFFTTFCQLDHLYSLYLVLATLLYSQIHTHTVLHLNMGTKDFLFSHMMDWSAQWLHWSAQWLHWSAVAALFKGSTRLFQIDLLHSKMH